MIAEFVAQTRNHLNTYAEQFSTVCFNSCAITFYFVGVFATSKRNLQLAEKCEIAKFESIVAEERANFPTEIFLSCCNLCIVKTLFRDFFVTVNAKSYAESHFIHLESNFRGNFPSCGFRSICCNSCTTVSYLIGTRLHTETEVSTNE